MNSRSPAPPQDPDRLIVELNGVATEATIIRSSRRRRTIAISVEAGSVKVRVPMRATRAQVEEAVRKHGTWVLARLAEPARELAELQFATSERIPYRGDFLTLCVRTAQVRRVLFRHEAESLLVDLPQSLETGEQRASAMKSELARWYRSRAVEVLVELTNHWASVSGLVPAKVFVRDQRRRWGSCAPDGTVRFNWRLILVEPALAEYVVVHELAHLRHRNHQSEFWAEVAGLIPDHLARRKRLTAIGRTLLQ